MRAVIAAAALVALTGAAEAAGCGWGGLRTCTEDLLTTEQVEREIRSERRYEPLPPGDINRYNGYYDAPREERTPFDLYREGYGDGGEYNDPFGALRD